MDQPNIQNTEKKNIDAYKALLEIDQSERNFKSRQGYSGAYALSLFVPPLGLYYFIKYVFLGNRSEEDVKAGCISLFLTVVSTLVSILLMGVLFKQTTSVLPDQGSDVLKDMITPANQNKLRELFQ